MGELDLLDAYMAEAFGFDKTEMFTPTGQKITEFPTPRLAGPHYPSNAGIRRTDLQRVLATKASELGCEGAAGGDCRAPER